MICKACQDTGAVVKRGVHDSLKYAFRCTCQSGTTKYPALPLDGSCKGYISWLDDGECREAQKSYKEGKLLFLIPKKLDLEPQQGDAFEPQETEW